MFIEKLSDKEVLGITGQILRVFGESDLRIKVHMQLADIKRTKEGQTVEVRFPAFGAKHFCILKDFDSIVSYWTFAIDNRVNKIYHKIMFEKFGEEYLNQIKKQNKNELIK